MRKFEKMVYEFLLGRGDRVYFESVSFDIKTKVKGQVCLECGCPMYRIAKYTPDFSIGSLVIEVKGGSFKPTDQARYKRFVKQHTDQPYVMVFRSNVRLRNLRGHPTVREWGVKNNIDVVIGVKELEDYLDA